MKLDHLTDSELINHVIKFDDDPVRVRLATANERTTGAIWDDLVDAGMDETYCTFRSEWGGDYHAGRYIMHLEEEIQIRDNDLQDLREELDKLKARTVAELIAELHSDINSNAYQARVDRDNLRKAEAERDHAKEQLKMWNHLRSE